MEVTGVVLDDGALWGGEDTTASWMLKESLLFEDVAKNEADLSYHILQAASNKLTPFLIAKIIIIKWYLNREES